MGFGIEKTFKVYYWPNHNKYPGVIGTRVAIVSATDRGEASYRFQRDYQGEFHTIDRIEEM